MYKKFLITLTDDEIDDLGGIAPEDEYSREFFRKQFGKDFLLDEARYINTEYSLQGSNVDKYCDWLTQNFKFGNRKNHKERIYFFLKILLANILINYYRYGFMGYFTIQLKSNVYSKNIYNQSLTAKSINEVLNYLQDIGWISIARKHKKPSLNQRGASKRYDWSSLFINGFRDYKIGIGNILFIGNPIELKKKKKFDGKEERVSYSDNQDTQELREEMNFINHALQRFEIYIHDKALINFCRKNAKYMPGNNELISKEGLIEGYYIAKYSQNSYTRVFSRGDFGKGGRLFHHWITETPKELRKKTIINGKSIIELDFGSMNMHLMYSLIGNSSFSKKDLYQVRGLKKLDRDLVKQFCTVAINTSTTYAAKLATYKAIHKKEIKSLKEAPTSFVKKLDKVVEELKEIHHALWDKYFKSQHSKKDFSVKLNFYESNIACAIMRKCLIRNIPCYSIHDSFLTQARHKHKLAKIMEDTFKEYFQCLGIDSASIPPIKSN